MFPNIMLTTPPTSENILESSLGYQYYHRRKVDTSLQTQTTIYNRATLGTMCSVFPAVITFQENVLA